MKQIDLNYSDFPDKASYQKAYNKLYYRANKTKLLNGMTDNYDKYRDYYANYRKNEVNRSRSREWYLNHYYDLTTEQFNELLEQQKHRCAICRSEEPGGKRQWHVDHCHKTGVVRGLLCGSCNSGLGFFKDNIEYLSEAIRYLNETFER